MDSNKKISRGNFLVGSRMTDCHGLERFAHENSKRKLKYRVQAVQRNADAFVARCGG
jgi:hypothetical protein